MREKKRGLQKECGRKRWLQQRSWGGQRKWRTYIFLRKIFFEEKKRYFSEEERRRKKEFSLGGREKRDISGLVAGERGGAFFWVAGEELFHCQG